MILLCVHCIIISPCMISLFLFSLCVIVLFFCFLKGHSCVSLLKYILGLQVSIYWMYVHQVGIDYAISIPQIFQRLCMRISKGFFLEPIHSKCILPLVEQNSHLFILSWDLEIGRDFGSFYILYTSLSKVTYLLDPMHVFKNVFKKYMEAY